MKKTYWHPQRHRGGIVRKGDERGRPSPRRRSRQTLRPFNRERLFRSPEDAFAPPGRASKARGSFDVLTREPRAPRPMPGAEGVRVGRLRGRLRSKFLRKEAGTLSGRGAVEAATERSRAPGKVPRSRREAREGRRLGGRVLVTLASKGVRSGEKATGRTRKPQTLKTEGPAHETLVCKNGADEY